jgi:hypothetical protein
MRFSVAATVHFLAVAVVALPVTASAQTNSPGLPEEYAARIRYRIYAPTADRIQQFSEMLRYLDSIGFQKDPGDDDEAEDPTETRVTGVIRAASAPKLLLEPHIKAIILIPQGYKLPEAADALVHVNLELATGLARESQSALEDQTRQRLLALGFRENIGYDNRGHSRMLGWVPLNHLDDLLVDLRTQPGGWLVPDVPYTRTPPPLRDVSPIRVVKVLPGETPSKESAGASAVQGPVGKLAPELSGREGPTRMEIILNFAPRWGDQRWRTLLEDAAPEISVEGILGALVTVTADAKSVSRLAGLNIVTGVRLPRPALTKAPPSEGITPDEALRRTGLQQLRHRGRGVRVAVIDTDFRGYEQYVGDRLPKTTRYIDVTIEHNPGLEPDRLADDGLTGSGTQAALAVALAAPEANLTLIRISPACPYQLQEVARAINGETARTEALEHRRDELERDAESLRKRRQQLIAERKEVLESYKQDEETEARRQDYQKRNQELAAAQESYETRLRRFTTLQRELAALKGTQIVSCSVVWSDGYPLGGTSALSRYFDTRPFGAALWLQAAGDTRGQTWAGLFRDDDHNGVMEFAPGGAALLPQRWTNELNFIGWQPYGHKEAVELPAGVKIHLSLQWQEAHDPKFSASQEDLYLQPLAKLRMLVLRQLDPEGKQIGSDELETVAASQGAMRLENGRNFAIYEQTLDFTTPSAGRYALRVEGVIPPGIQPASLNAVPVQHALGWELRPRVFIDAPDAPARNTGRPVFIDYATRQGDVGMPADSQGVITIGAVDASGHPEPASSTGPPLELGLLRKPDLFSYGSIDSGAGPLPGTPSAAAFATGLLAAGRSAGFVWTDVLQATGTRPDRLLRLR